MVFLKYFFQFSFAILPQSSLFQPRLHPTSLSLSFFLSLSSAFKRFLASPFCLHLALERFSLPIQNFCFSHSSPSLTLGSFALLLFVSTIQRFFDSISQAICSLFFFSSLHLALASLIPHSLISFFSRSPLTSYLFTRFQAQAFCTLSEMGILLSSQY